VVDDVYCFLELGMFSSFFSRGKGNSADSENATPSDPTQRPFTVSTPTPALTPLEIHLNQQFDRAENLLKAAVAADSLGNNHDAFDLYQQSLNIWLEILNQTTDETRRRQIADLIALYMSKAEAVKMRLLSPPPPAPAPSMRARPSPQTTKPSHLRAPTRGGQQATAASAAPSTLEQGKVDEAAILSEMLDSSPDTR
jgi:hypothetical protein